MVASRKAQWAVCDIIRGLCLSHCLLAVWAALEQASTQYPVEGATRPDTYLSDSSLIACTAIDWDSSLAPWDPTPEAAASFCSSLPSCGGYVYTPSAASVAAGGPAQAEALYCHPQSFTAGTASATSGISLVRHIYESCDVRLTIPVTVVGFHGAISSQRAACFQPARGLSRSQHRRPKPNAVRSWQPPTKTVELSGVHYEVGVQVFRTLEAAQNESVDGTAHAMNTASGVVYYMPGASHASREQSEKPFALDGYYPLFSTQTAAEAASARGGGEGFAKTIGPTEGNRSRWTVSPYVQVYYMPRDGPRTFRGTHVTPFQLDGYYPLFLTQTEAEGAADNGTAQSHGPGSSTGHPLSWSTGEYRVFYMPTSGFDKYYGDFQQTSPDTSNYAAVISSTASTGEGEAQAAAAVAVAAVR